MSINDQVSIYDAASNNKLASTNFFMISFLEDKLNVFLKIKVEIKAIVKSL